MAQQDFTQGSIRKQLFTYAGPIMLTNLLQVSYQFIDSLWVGNLLGANALGAVTISTTVVLTILAFIIGINNATLTILSQQKGMKDDHGIKMYVNAFIVILTTLSIVVALVGFYFSKPILRFLDTPEQMLHEAVVYLEINFLGILFIMGYNFIGTLLRALGDSKTPLRFVFLAVGLNAVLDPLFISVFDWGIHGAAYATILAQGISFLLSLVYTMRYKLVPYIRPRIPKKEEVWLILKLGIPAGLQMMVIYAGITAILSVVNSFDGAVVAGFGASQRIDSLITIPAMALGTAVNSMAGQNIGANKWDRVHQIAMNGTFFTIGIMLTIALFVFLFARGLTTLFIQDKNAITFGTDYLKIIAFSYPFLGINFILNGIVRGSGAMYQVLVLNLLSFWLLRYPFTYICSKLIGQKGIALGIGISFVISSIFAFSYYKWGGWKTKALFSTGK
ncbi:MATE family efflux transporter [Ferdinandcohnia sp. Marseille-Q9671]